MAPSIRPPARTARRPPPWVPPRGYFHMRRAGFRAPGPVAPRHVFHCVNVSALLPPFSAVPKVTPGWRGGNCPGIPVGGTARGLPPAPNGCECWKLAAAPPGAVRCANTRRLPPHREQTSGKTNFYWLCNSITAWMESSVDPPHEGRRTPHEASFRPWTRSGVSRNRRAGGRLPHDLRAERRALGPGAPIQFHWTGRREHLPRSLLEVGLVHRLHPQARCYLKTLSPVAKVDTCCVSGVKALATMSALEQNTDRPGADYRRFDVATEDARLCRDACAKENQCAAYTLVRANVHGPSAYCTLKSSASAPQSNNPSCVSGFKQEWPMSPLETDTDRPGLDLSGQDSASPEACRAACSRDAGCKAFTFVKPGVHGPSGRCYFKTAIPQARPGSNCCASGVKW
ncbi:hypothetical protein F0U59_07505 [Archangium gephyra]|nr:hypothetical protein F0U59_07505 [Archangium gephyra]